MIFHVPDIHTFMSMLRHISLMPYIHMSLSRRRIENQKSVNLPVVSRYVITISAVNASRSDLLHMEHTVPPTIGLPHSQEMSTYYWGLVNAVKTIARENSDLIRFGSDDAWVHGVLPLTQVMSDELMITPSKSDIESITSVYE